jgi:hypothetical protein
MSEQKKGNEGAGTGDSLNLNKIASLRKRHLSKKIKDEQRRQRSHRGSQGDPCGQSGAQGRRKEDGGGAVGWACGALVLI